MSTNYIDQITDTASTPVTYDLQEATDFRIFRATCSTDAATAEKVATLQDPKNFSLTTGVRVAVTFQYGNTAETPTLRVDGSSTGTAKAIAFPTSATSYATGNGDSYNTWGARETVIFTYSGTYWMHGGSGLSSYNMDTKVTQTPLNSTNTTKALLISNYTNTQSTAGTGPAYFANNASYNDNSSQLRLGGTLTGPYTIVQPNHFAFSDGTYMTNLLPPSTKTQTSTIYFPDKNGTLALDADMASIKYGTCDTSAGTTTKVVTCSDFVKKDGTIIGILFSTANTASSIYMNINDTGGTYVYMDNNMVSSGTNSLLWSANTIIYLIYVHSRYYYLGSSSADSIYGTSSTAATTTAKVATIPSGGASNLVLRTGTIVAITFTNANTSKSALTLNINSIGAKTIYYNNAATSSSNPLFWDAGETLTFIYNGSYYYFLNRSKHTNITYGSSDPSGAAETGTVYFKTGASAYTFQPRVNLTRSTSPALPTPITTTEQTMHSFTLPPGMYLITFQINHGSYTAGTCRWDLKAGSNTITQVRSVTGATSGLIQNGCGLVQCTNASTTISFTAVVSSGTMTTGELHYSYIKLF